MKTIIECGANRGIDTQRLLDTWADSVVYAIEPTHELLVEHLYPMFKNNPRVRVLPFAIDVENTFKAFNIAGHHDWGCSSLYEFAPQDQRWIDREDFYFTHSYYVPTITLYDLCNLYNIQVIDYLWIDTQGNDFNTLLSLKDKIKDVMAGRCEVAYNTELYKGTNNKVELVVNWLKEHGFEVQVQPDYYQAECDIHFSRIV